jgi:hypothetical protein
LIDHVTHDLDDVPAHGLFLLPLVLLASEATAWRTFAGRFYIRRFCSFGLRPIGDFEVLKLALDFFAWKFLNAKGVLSGIAASSS